MGNSILVLVGAVVVLWLAVTGRLPRLIDALDVVKGTETASATSATAAVGGGTATLQLPSAPGMPSLPVTVSLPTLPQNFTQPNVDF